MNSDILCGVECRYSNIIFIDDLCQIYYIIYIVNRFQPQPHIEKLKDVEGIRLLSPYNNTDKRLRETGLKELRFLYELFVDII